MRRAGSVQPTASDLHAERRLCGIAISTSCPPGAAASGCSWTGLPVGLWQPPPPPLERQRWWSPACCATPCWRPAWASGGSCSWAPWGHARRTTRCGRRPAAAPAAAAACWPGPVVQSDQPVLLANARGMPPGAGILEHRHLQGALAAAAAASGAARAAAGHERGVAGGQPCAHLRLRGRLPQQLR